MSRLSKLALCLGFVLLISAKGGKHSVWLVVSNSSPDNQPVDIHFGIVGRAEEKVVSTEHTIAPGTQQLPEQKVREGVYQAMITANGDKVSALQPFTLDADRWILVNYIKEDSLSIVKTYGWVDTTRFKKVGDKFATINISIDSRRPAGL